LESVFTGTTAAWKKLLAAVSLRNKFVTFCSAA
jgi:hypothetical protein